MQEFFDNNFIGWLSFQWNIEFECVRPDIDIQGSPERTLSRMVFQGKNNELLLIEKFSAKKFELRQNIAKSIEYLNGNGLESALLPRKSNAGEFLPFYEGSCFQLTSFLDSTGIERPDYLAWAKTGKNFALFLIDLATASENMEDIITFKPFSIKEYIYELFNQMEKYDNLVYKKYLRFLEFLEKEFMGIHDKLPLCFCHGDLHPLNVIWNHGEIKAVIDWEFAGLKPDIHDAANLVGCAGIENPDGLAMPMVTSFIKEVRRKGVFSETGWQFFPEYVLALRFAWLSEWLRKKDSQMLEMEETYMGILVDNMEVLRQGWEIDNNN